MKTIFLFALLIAGVSFAFAEKNHNSLPGLTPPWYEMTEARIRILPPVENEEPKLQDQQGTPKTDSAKPANTNVGKPHMSLFDAGASV